MEHITDIDKTAHLEECVEAVREIINPDDYGLTEKLFMLLQKKSWILLLQWEETFI